MTLTRIRHPQHWLPTLFIVTLWLLTTAAQFPEREFGKAKSFKEALQSAGLSGREADALIVALEPKLDLRRCRSTDRLQVVRDSANHITRFVYRRGVTDVYEATPKPDGSGFAVRRYTGHENTTLTTLRGSVRSTLSAALAEAGLDDDAASTFQSALAQRLNLARDVRAGDRFSAVLNVDGVASGKNQRVMALSYRSSVRGEVRVYFYDPRTADRGRGDAGYYDAKGRGYRPASWLSAPVGAPRITSAYSSRRRHPVLRRVMPHNGVDYAAATGTPVRTVADGTVLWAGPLGPNGKLVRVQHAGGYESIYAHLSRIAPPMKVGRKVRRGTVLGYVGSTGLSTGPHLHFGMKRGGKFVNPLAVLHQPRTTTLSRHVQPSYAQHVASLDRLLSAGDPAQLAARSSR